MGYLLTLELAPALAVKFIIEPFQDVGVEEVDESVANVAVILGIGRGLL